MLFRSPLGGAGVAYWAPIAERYGLDIEVVNSTVDPTFRFMPLDWDGRIRMDCSSPYAMTALIALRDRFIELAYGRISKIKPLIPMSNKPKPTGPNYHPLWKQISANWVCMNGNPQTVAVCLETIWNYKNCTTEGYRAVGSNLAAAVQEFLKERLDRDNTRLPPPVAADGK